MSSAADPEITEIIELYNNSFVVNCFACVIATLLLYDYLLTLHQEIKLFWTRKVTGASVLFFVIRYLTLLNYDILVCVTFASFSDVSCARYMLAQTAFTIFQYFPWAAFSALRVLALSRWNWFLATATFLLALGPAAVNLTRYGFDLTGANLLTLGCKTSNDATMLQGNILSAVSRTSLILSDTLVIGVTVAMTWRRGATLAWQGVGTSLSDLLLNHGIKYYAVLLCLNILQVVLTHLDIGTVSQQASYISTVSEPLTAIFISRFLLDLQSANQTSLELCSGAGENPLTANTDGTLRFAARSRVIGSLGASTAPDSASIYFEEDGC